VGGSIIRCRRCGSAALEDATEALSVALPRSGVAASIAVPGRRCGGCGGVHVEGAVVARAHLAFARALADAGVHTGDAVRHMRQSLGLRAADLARLLDVTPETMSHWETGKCRPNRAAFVVLCALVQDEVEGRTTTRDRLRTLAGGAAYPRTLAVQLP
jgi:putative zinc finger/helix-turn-helix YgiT family protein